MFELHPQLVQDCILLGHLPVSQLLLMQDSHYPWCILVPAQAGVTEIYQLSEQDQQQLQVESSLLAKTLMQVFVGDKMNIGALGNVVSQLHIHHVVRYRDDLAWPKPIWGQHEMRPYSDEALATTIAKITAALPQNLFKAS
jgi:diadenosine tetraphosphate (Ap4A) HIT family hydrolase